MNFLEKISPFERRDLTFSWFCLAIAFMLGSSDGLMQIIGTNRISINILVTTFIVAMVTVGLSFVLHELAHKFVAIQYGYWAEFRKNTQMLLIAIAIAVITGIVFAAPGATLINTAGREMTKKENGIISLAGPLTNLILAIPFSACLIISILVESALNNLFTAQGFLFYIGMVGFQVNAMLAFFNMLPFGPLDGRKILHWNAVAFTIMITISLIILYVSLQPEMLISLLF